MPDPDTQIAALRISLEQQGLMQYDGGDPLFGLLLEVGRIVSERRARAAKREENQIDRTRINFEVARIEDCPCAFCKNPIPLDAFETFCLEDR